MVMQLAVNDVTVAKLEQVARERETTSQKLAEQAIYEFLRSEERRLMQREMQAFAKLHDELLRAYPNEFVAIHQGRLLDHDRDQLALFQRVDKRYPNVAVLIKLVQDDLEEVYTFRSPRLEGAL